MSDLATPNHRDIEAVWGSFPFCVHTNRNLPNDPTQFHHVLGRGGKYNRKIMSSVLNQIPIAQSIHCGGLRDHPDQARVYLRIAFEKWSYAVALGKIEPQEKDKEFMLYADQWLLQHNLPTLYSL